ncbi:L,D-transpeptidase family protein [Sulfurimonas sp. SAG-AH-194-I05]|nr:L,D-transpeptidase family protein [Sulfurimonas sp. SAG-AH-194-I05]MDF1874583.1 L,D-transpeptidase family protein [Sulfurimonas sp. SAG-AH-194-I05]
MLNKVIFLSFVTLSLYANPILTQYRENGFLNIEKKMDFELSKKDYWTQYLKNKDTSFGYLESYNSVLVCDKDEATLNLYQQDENKNFKTLKKFSAFTGENKGDKNKEGDLKTPHGVYNLTQKIYKLDSFYGPLAFVTSYPNTYDKYRGKNGSGIWIHGLPTEQERDEYTKGCIAINNSNIKCLDKNIDITNTLLIISPNQTPKNVSKKVLAKILANLYEWRYSWLYNDTQKYLSFYSNDFIRDDGMKYDRFIKYKTRIFNKQESKQIIFNSINVVPYPDSKNIFVITFKEKYKSNSFEFVGDKVLMITIHEDSSFKIFTEK